VTVRRQQATQTVESCASTGCCTSATYGSSRTSGTWNDTSVTSHNMGYTASSS
jgi:hypothetical protein